MKKASDTHGATEASSETIGVELLPLLLLGLRGGVELGGLMFADADSERLFEELVRGEAIAAGEAGGLYDGLALR